jgi:hypothetical protein
VRSLRCLDSSASVGVDSSPATRDVEQFQMAEACGEGGVNDEMVADGFEAKHCPQE